MVPAIAGEEATQGTKSGYGNWLRNTVHEHKRNTTMTMFTNTQNVLFASVVEPPLFLAAPAPDVRGPGADSGSDQIGSAPAPGKKKAAPAPYTNIFHFEFLKSELLMQVFFGSHLPL